MLKALQFSEFLKNTELPPPAPPAAPPSAISTPIKKHGKKEKKKKKKTNKKTQHCPSLLNLLKEHLILSFIHSTNSEHTPTVPSTVLGALR